MFMQLIKKVVKAILPYRIIALRREFNLKREIKRRLTKRDKLVFEVHLVDYCNLNCQCCGSFSPLADKKYYDVEKLENDFKRISNIAGDRVEAVRLLGGEPLLHPDLLKVFDIVGKYFNKIEFIDFITNAILLGKQPTEFWESCKRNNIQILITKYPINLPFSKFEKIGKEYGVIVKYFNDKSILKTMVKYTMDINGNVDPQKSFSLCHLANTCTMLDDGKIYPCSRIARIKYFNNYFKTDLKVCDNDYIDIYKTDNLDDILEFLCKPVPFCRYCDIEKYVHEINWALSKRSISEWV